ncbi:MAG: ProQ/FINO family protein [Methylococcales bacterium]|nr:ProQ/FINO family protein [Methylococcales bacterium]
MSKTLQESINQRVFENWLYRQYPNVFSLKTPIPLAIGTGEELMKQLPENITQAAFKAAMIWYCRRISYQKAILKHTQRINLQGELVGEVAKNDRCLAQYRLDKAAKKFAQPNKYALPVETPTEPTPIELIEPMQPTEEKIKSTKLVLKKKTVAPTAEVTIAKVEFSPSLVKATNDNVAIAKSLKVTLVVEPASIPVIDSTGMKKVTLTIQVANTDIQITVDLSAKSYRKAIGSIEELGADGCNAILQGSMKRYGTIDDAGLVVQPKKAASSE